MDWKSAGGDIWELMLDVGRHKLIDVEMVGDEGNRRDMTDLRTGQNSGSAGKATPQVRGGSGGNSNNLLILAGVALAAGGLVWFMAD